MIRVVHRCPQCDAVAVLHVANATVTHRCPRMSHRPPSERFTTFRVVAEPVTTTHQDAAAASRRRRSRARSKSS